MPPYVDATQCSQYSWHKTFFKSSRIMIHETFIEKVRLVASKLSSKPNTTIYNHLCFCLFEAFLFYFYVCEKNDDCLTAMCSTLFLLFGSHAFQFCTLFAFPFLSLNAKSQIMDYQNFPHNRKNLQLFNVQCNLYRNLCLISKNLAEATSLSISIDSFIIDGQLRTR